MTAATPPRWTEEQIAMLRQMAADNHHVGEMSEAIGRSTKAVHKKLAALKIKFRMRPKGYETHAGPVSSSPKRSDYGYQPKNRHPDWSGVRFR